MALALLAVQLPDAGDSMLHSGDVSNTYTSSFAYSQPALFMFRAFGHTKSSVLNGGLPRWEVEGYPVETSAPEDPTPLDPESESGEYDKSLIKSEFHIS